MSERDRRGMQSSRVIDVSGQGIAHICQLPQSGEGGGRVVAITADNNNLSTLTGIDSFPTLIQLSVRENSLVQMEALAPLVSLTTLNLQNNSISEIEGLERLVNLQWLCLAGNSIREMRGVSTNLLLSHLDLSDNCISRLSDISSLTQLKTLLLHGNAISSLQNIPRLLPPSVTTLTLAENEVQDLNEMAFLSALRQLAQLSVMGNPCVSLADSRMLFDYRPYVLYWCPALSTLDGIVVSANESQRSTALFPHGQNYPFSLGQHSSLVQYLTATCPLSSLQLLMNSTASASSLQEDRENGDPNLAAVARVLQSRDPQRQADILQKLRALQVVRQMIATQEHLLQQQQDLQAAQHGASVASEADTLQFSTKQGELANRDLVNGQMPTFFPDARRGESLVTASAPFNSHNSIPRSDQPPSVPHSSQSHSNGSILHLGQQSHSKGPSPHSSLFQFHSRTDSGPEGAIKLHTTSSTLGENMDRETAPSEDSSRSSSPSILSLLPSNISTDAPAVKLTATNATAGEFKAEAVQTQQDGPGSDALGLNVEERRGELVQSFGTGLPFELLQDQRRTHLRILNEKIAQRQLQHSDQATSVHLQSGSKPSEPFLGMRVAREPTSQTLSPPTRADVSKEVSPTNYTLPGVPSYVHTQPSVPSTSVAMTTANQIATGSHTHAQRATSEQSSPETHRESDPDLLESTSSYLPLPDGDRDTSLQSECDLSALAASLSKAYGLSDPEENSQLLSTLVGEKVSLSQLGKEFGASSKQGDSQNLPSSQQLRSFQDATHNADTDSSLFQRTSEGLTTLATDTRDTTIPSRTERGKTAMGKTNHEKEIPQVDFVDADIGRSPLEKSLPPRRYLMSETEAVVRLQAALRGYLCRKRLAPDIQCYRAATIIQAAWRGYHARQHNPVVVEVRKKLRRKKLEAYVTTLYVQLHGCRQELAHQVHVVQLQEETIKSLLIEVESLQCWRGEVELKRRNRAATTIQRHWRGYSARKSCSHSSPRLSSQTSALWALCLSLKEQVSQLQASLATVVENTYVYGETRQRFQKMGFIEPGPQSSSLSPTNRDSIETQEELPPPLGLKMSHFSDTCVLLQWAPAPQAGTRAVLQGYRVYVNGEVEGMVGPGKSKAYIESLDPSTTYRITIRAVYNTGESLDSNPVMASLSVQPPGKDRDEISSERTSELNATPHSNIPPVADDSITESHKFPSNATPHSNSPPVADDSITESHNFPSNGTLPLPCSHHQGLSVTANRPDLPLPFQTAETDDQDPHSSTGLRLTSLDKQTLSEKPLTISTLLASASAPPYASGDPTPLASETHQSQQLHDGEGTQVPGSAAVQAHASGEKVALASSTTHENSFKIEDSSLPVYSGANIEPEAITVASRSYPDKDAAQGRPNFVGEAKQDTSIETDGELKDLENPELRDFQHFEPEENQMRANSEDITAPDSSITETGTTIPPISGTTIDPISLTGTFPSDSANKSMIVLPPQVAPPPHLMPQLPSSPQTVQPELTDSTLASPLQRKEDITVQEKPVSSRTKPETPVTHAPQMLATKLACETPDMDSSNVESTAEESELAEQVVDKGPEHFDLLCNHPVGMALPTVIARSITGEGSQPTTRTAHTTTSGVSTAPGGKQEPGPTSTTHVVDSGPTTGDLAFLLLSQLETDISSSKSNTENNTN